MMEEKNIPNGWILVGYYTSVLGIFPILGMAFGPLGFFFTLIGLYLLRNKEQKPGRWLGWFSLFFGALSSGFQVIVVYNVLYSVS